MSVPRVYTAISGVIADLSHSGIAKRQTNVRDQYQYRGIDDVYDSLSPLLAKHRLCILPRILKRTVVERRDELGNLLMSVSVKAAFDFVCAEDGSKHAIQSFGEALDAGDKATSKAMTAAYKQAVLQAFCVPVGGTDDADSQSFRLKAEDQVVEPAQGWTRWGADVIEIVASCQSGEAVDRVQASNRGYLRAIAMHDPKLYAAIGEVIRDRRSQLSPAGAKPGRLKATGQPRVVTRKRRAVAAVHA